MLQREITHVRYIEHKLTQVGGILVSLYKSECFLLGEEQFFR